MIKNPSQAVIKDARGDYPVVFDVNFDPMYSDCVKISMGTYERVVKYSDLFAFMFTLGTKEQQAKMIPVREELGHQYMKQIQVKLKKDMKEGEMMVVNVPINVPQVIEDAIIKEKEEGQISPFIKKEV